MVRSIVYFLGTTLIPLRMRSSLRVRLRFWAVESPISVDQPSLWGSRTILFLLKESEGQFYLYVDCTILSLPQTLLVSPTTHQRAFVYRACAGITELGVSLVASWARGAEGALALSCLTPQGHNQRRKKYQCHFPNCVDLRPQPQVDFFPHLRQQPTFHFEFVPRDTGESEI